MAHAKKRKLANGKVIWEAVWINPDGTRGTKRPFATKKAADTYLVKKEEAKLRGVEFDPKAGGITLREYAQKWLSSRQDLKPTCSPDIGMRWRPTMEASATSDCGSCGLTMFSVVTQSRASRASTYRTG